MSTLSERLQWAVDGAVAKMRAAYRRGITSTNCPQCGNVHEMSHSRHVFCSPDCRMLFYAGRFFPKHRKSHSNKSRKAAA